jgi:hypothetical protein
MVFVNLLSEKTTKKHPTETLHIKIRPRSCTIKDGGLFCNYARWFVEMSLVPGIRAYHQDAEAGCLIEIDRASQTRHVTGDQPPLIELKTSLGRIIDQIQVTVQVTIADIGTAKSQA